MKHKIKIAIGGAILAGAIAGGVYFSGKTTAPQNFKVSAAIAKQDEQDLASGHKRKKQGDIIAVKPANWQWGTKEYEDYLIIELDLGNVITTIEDAQKLTVPQFEIGELWYPEETPKITGKRRYNIPIADLIAKTTVVIDVEKMVEKGNKYQPLEKVSIPFDGLIQDKILNRKLQVNDLTIIKNIGK